MWSYLLSEYLCLGILFHFLLQQMRFLIYPKFAFLCGVSLSVLSNAEGVILKLKKNHNSTTRSRSLVIEYEVCPHAYMSIHGVAESLV